MAKKRTIGWGMTAVQNGGWWEWACGGVYWRWMLGPGLTLFARRTTTEEYTPQVRVETLPLAGMFTEGYACGYAAGYRDGRGAPPE